MSAIFVKPVVDKQAAKVVQSIGNPSAGEGSN